MPFLGVCTGTCADVQHCRPMHREKQFLYNCTAMYSNALTKIHFTFFESVAISAAQLQYLSAAFVATLRTQAHAVVRRPPSPRLPRSTYRTRWTRTRRVSRTPRSLSVDVCTTQSILIAGGCGCPPSISIQTVIKYRFCICYCRLSEPH